PSPSTAAPPSVLRPSPTRRSSDLWASATGATAPSGPYSTLAASLLFYNPLYEEPQMSAVMSTMPRNNQDHPIRLDRKSTRLNSSHVSISYAVFCVKKKIWYLILLISKIHAHR